MMKSFLFIHPHSLSLLFCFVFLTFGHGTKFNSKEAEPSNKIELSSLPAFAYLTRTRGNEAKTTSCLAG